MKPNPLPTQPTDYHLTARLPKLLELIERDYLQVPNVYSRALRRLHSAVQACVESPATHHMVFQLHEATAYGGTLWFSDPSVAGWHCLTKGKLRWSELEFYGFHNPVVIDWNALHKAA